MAIEFPFTKVTPLELAFPVVPNYEQVVEAIPEKFSAEPPSDEAAIFIAAAEKFFYGTFDPRTDLPGYLVRTRNIGEATAQLEYMKVWSGSYQPKHEQKIQVLGWLLSLAFKKSE